MPQLGPASSSPANRSTAHLALLALSLAAIAFLLVVDETSIAEELTLGAAWVIPVVVALAVAGFLRDRGFPRSDRWIVVPAAAVVAGAVLWNGVAAEGGTGAGIAVGLLAGIAVVATRKPPGIEGPRMRSPSTNVAHPRRRHGGAVSGTAKIILRNVLLVAVLITAVGIIGSWGDRPGLAGAWGSYWDQAPFWLATGAALTALGTGLATADIWGSGRWFRVVGTMAVVVLAAYGIFAFVSRG